MYFSRQSGLNKVGDKQQNHRSRNDQKHTDKGFNGQFFFEDEIRKRDSEQHAQLVYRNHDGNDAVLERAVIAQPRYAGRYPRENYKQQIAGGNFHYFAALFGCENDYPTHYENDRRADKRSEVRFHAVYADFAEDSRKRREDCRQARKRQPSEFYFTFLRNRRKSVRHGRDRCKFAGGRGFGNCLRYGCGVLFLDHQKSSRTDRDYRDDFHNRYFFAEHEEGDQKRQYDARFVYGYNLIHVAELQRFEKAQPRRAGRYPREDEKHPRFRRNFRKPACRSHDENHYERHYEHYRRSYRGRDFGRSFADADFGEYGRKPRRCSR